VISATGNNITSVQDGISLSSATGVVATGNHIVNISDKGINLQDKTSGGNNNVKGNTIIEAACGISTSGAATSDTFLPNKVQNSALATCQ
jgi:Right handed beta helix region